MNKTEMADGGLTLEQGRWLAENVLGLVRVNFVSDALKDSCEEWIWFSSDRIRSYREEKIAPCLTIIEYLKTPDGFFAVWEAVDTSDIWAKKVMLKAITDMYETVGGKDRYEAFYNAVYEVMKEEGKRDD